MEWIVLDDVIGFIAWIFCWIVNFWIFEYFDFFCVCWDILIFFFGFF